MKQLTGSVAVCFLLVLTMSSKVQSEVTIKKITYHKWEGAYQLSNKTVELVFVPQIGRIMRYGYVGGPNILWENSELEGRTVDLKQPGTDWMNFGGDKLWVAPQNRWGWPPDPPLDCGSQTVTELPNKHLLVTGMESQKHGIRFSRDIELAATGTGVTITNTMTNIGDKDVDWAIWEVTQVDSPDLTRMPLHKSKVFTKGYYIFKDADPQLGRMKLTAKELTLQRDLKASSKVGGNSPLGWIAAEKAGVRFEISAKVEKGANYPDDGCTSEIYTNPDPLKYIELELLSPMEILSPHQATLFYHKMETLQKRGCAPKTIS